MRSLVSSANVASFCGEIFKILKHWSFNGSALNLAFIPFPISFLLAIEFAMQTTRGKLAGVLGFKEIKGIVTLSG